jgi:hypothetical protein
MLPHRHTCFHLTGSTNTRRNGSFDSTAARFWYRTGMVGESTQGESASDLATAGRSSGMAVASGVDHLSRAIRE